MLAQNPFQVVGVVGGVIAANGLQYPWSYPTACSFIGRWGLLIPAGQGQHWQHVWRWAWQGVPHELVLGSNGITQHEQGRVVAGSKASRQSHEPEVSRCQKLPSFPPDCHLIRGQVCSQGTVDHPVAAVDLRALSYRRTGTFLDSIRGITLRQQKPPLPVTASCPAL